MKTKRLPNYLKTYRKRAGLSQSEVALLLGCRSGAKVSRYERCARLPTLKTILAYEAIFGASAQELFAGIFEEVEQKVIEQAKALRTVIDKEKETQIKARKQEFLRMVIITPDILAENS